MIRNFEMIDPRRLKANQFSKPGDMSFVFNDPAFIKQTLVGENGDVYAIICFRAYWRKNFISFFLISEDMPIIYARELRKFLHNAILDFEADRVQTDSVACEKLDKWHKFLGFTFEGKREKMVFDKDYHLWGMLKGRDF